MKQKIVLKVTMVSAKCGSKALKVAVGVAGFESAAFQGDDKNQIVVTGDGIDSVVLANLFRKHIGFTELVSVGPVEAEKKKEEEKNVTKLNRFRINIITNLVCLQLNIIIAIRTNLATTLVRSGDD